MDTEIKHLLYTGLTVEEASLATFEPKYHKLNCAQLSLIKAVSFGYGALPAALSFSPGIIGLAVTGDASYMISGIPLLYSINAYVWGNPKRNGTILVNKIASTFLPEDYSKHHKHCINIEKNKLVEEEKEASRQLITTMLRRHLHTYNSTIN